MLSDSESEHDDLQITINEHYAKAYAHRKEREELQKLKDKYGSDFDENELEASEDSEDLESEDEDGEELTPAVDAAILRTLARIKKRDPAIYGKDNIFEEEHKKTQDVSIGKRKKEKNAKPLTIRQQNLESALNPTSRSPSPQPLTHVQEQSALREEIVSAFHTAVADDASEEENDLLVPREKTKDEIEKDEEDYRAWLQREVGADLRELVTVEPGDDEVGEGPVEEAEEEGKNKKKNKKDKSKKDGARKVVKAKSASKEDADQQFLLDYILNRGWIDRSSRRVPTYNEITGEISSSSKTNGISNAADDTHDADADHPNGNALSEDEFEEVAEQFETSYNFRFEEPDAGTIKTYPRNLASTVRREDTARKEAREKRKARKEEEKLKKREEVKRLKALKMKELKAKLELIGKEAGRTWTEAEEERALDLDADWDPIAHEKQMGALYGQEGSDEDGGDVDGEKPTWDDDIDIDDIAPDWNQNEAGPSHLHDGVDTSQKKKKKKKKKKDMEGGDEVDAGVDVDMMDAERVEEGGGWDDLVWDGTEEMRKKVWDKYMEELDAMEFNDMVGDLPTRFKYTPVQPDNFGLTPAEILLATDAELNSYVGLKKFAPYRTKAARRWDNKRNERLQELRKGLKERGAYSIIEGMGSRDRDEDGEKKKKRKGKKERMKAKADAEGGEDESEEKLLGKRKSLELDAGAEEAASTESKKRRRRHKKAAAE
ncbi:Krr1-domain-containing protein [Punctularia strigosozonata HHB-11173 SS5]|uniref:Krr1-domain-containing protein n=1 Tax=Punctularia strigosozonata (strain HHB-11173) TaxID=741275 RepID=UPI00044184B6|nr:Krr1-domain-containing protein [Punctularia strigosozonata HHB-11173 SS5]EIN06607.1 Krr1-domain-containing protein [Punctularia strigosozonata HHB-11173 SS5]